MFKILIYLFVGGGLGAVIRYLIGKATLSFYGGSFPLATLIANLVACILLAFIAYTYSLKSGHNNKALYLFLITGFCGGLSTFSAFSFETFELLKQGQFSYAVLNVIISITVGLGAMYFIYNKSAQL